MWLWLSRGLVLVGVSVIKAGITALIEREQPEQDRLIRQSPHRPTYAEAETQRLSPPRGSRCRPAR